MYKEVSKNLQARAEFVGRQSFLDDKKEFDFTEKTQQWIYYTAFEQGVLWATKEICKGLEKAKNEEA